MALTQHELNQAQCHLQHYEGRCRHDVLSLAAKCHPSSGITAEYIKSRGIMQMR